MPRKKRETAKKRQKREEADERGERSFWSGTITFGLVSVPVSLITAVRNIRPRLRMLDEEGVPLHRRYYCPEEDELVDPDELVRGYELDDGRMVILTDAELERLEPRKTRDIDLHMFVDADDVEPLLYETPYFLVPEGSSNKAYRLLAEVLEKEKKIGIATFVMREKEYLVAVISEKGILRAEVLRMPDEVRDTGELGLEPAHVPEKDVEKMQRSIKKMAGTRLSMAELADDDTRRLEQLIESRRKKGEVVEGVTEETAEEEGGEVIDLMAVLKQSLAHGERGGARSGARRGARKTARKAATRAARKAPRSPRRRATRASGPKRTARKRAA